MDRAYFLLCSIVGRLLRSSRYAHVRIVLHDGKRQVRKRRRFYSPLLVGLGRPLMGILDTGVRVLPQPDWVERERLLWRDLHGAPILVEDDGTLVLPCLAGETLASLLDDSKLDESLRRRAIVLAVVALADFHRAGFTHGDAMAENVMVDLDAGVARWLDFETVHESNRPMAWRRADDLRALLATCLLRTAPGKLAETLHLILESYSDEEVTRHLAESFITPFRRPLTYHLAQAGLSYPSFRQIGKLLKENVKIA